MQHKSAVADRDYYTIREAAAVLNVSAPTVWRWVTAGKLPAYRVGQRSIRIRQCDAEALRIGTPSTQSASEPLPVLEPPAPLTPEERTKLQALVEQILEHGNRINIAPLTTADLVRRARRWHS